MPGFLLNLSSMVICAHGGQAKPTVPNVRLRAMGLPTATQPFPYVIAGCVNPPPPVNVGPCILGNWIVAAVRVKSMGMPVLLMDSQAICVPTGTPLTVVLTQMRVKAM
ncbi:hypothetical protein G7B40_009175 [Aetokthonos hydrillicola Thurmond2011]|jgi:hypothetical protein|uniref:DUF4280 domain-containing protein n=1 Tax=Aetokthonos hydrillicola Thurmond2011 TaxID=2712845 RepID=A0AAP5M9S5_9CYAN|nr:hypothetical protein [Aetokthonos hydrillicola]MBO3457579.1 hypothetical protein [Aetokthonos hydrillicola CCALA 1050]MBW4590912.1 hypothetical protein [Aetokthonos hydrillicola CCALA 1050]MDR9894739.1 hypothetical protein [Aetokthonos hydrillicola Thurmond2011]